jgi:hypothetical protein
MASAGPARIITSKIFSKRHLELLTRRAKREGNTRRRKDREGEDSGDSAEMDIDANDDASNDVEMDDGLSDNDAELRRVVDSYEAAYSAVIDAANLDAYLDAEYDAERDAERDAECDAKLDAKLGNNNEHRRRVGIERFCAQVIRFIDRATDPFISGMVGYLLVAWGDGFNATTGQRFTSCAREVERVVAQTFAFLRVDEYCTSQRCPSCGSALKSVQPAKSSGQANAGFSGRSNICTGDKDKDKQCAFGAGRGTPR